MGSPKFAHPPLATASVVSTVSATTGATTVIAANNSRRGISIYNDSTRRVQIKFGSSVSSTSYTVRLAGSELYEMPIPIWVGMVTARTTASAATLRVTELT